MTIALFKWYLKMNSEVQTGDTFQGKSTKSSFITAFLYAVSTKRNYVWIRIRKNRIIRPYGRSLKFGEIFLKIKIIVYKKIDCENCGKALENLKIQDKHIVEELLSIIVNSCGVGGVCCQTQLATASLASF